MIAFRSCVSSRRHVILAFFTLLTLLVSLVLLYKEGFYRISDRVALSEWTPSWIKSQPIHQDSVGGKTHPIDDLILKANADLQLVLEKETHGLKATAEAYRRRRGRHPPPWFDEWVEFAEQNNALLIEDFFDRIYDDLQPFWGMLPDDMRITGANWIFKLSIRNGEVTKSVNDRAWLDIWQDMFARIANRLPDMDIPLNEMDESRIMVPAERINELVIASAINSSQIMSTGGIINSFSTYLPKHVQYSYPWRFDGPFWQYVHDACPPTSAGRNTDPHEPEPQPPSFPKVWPDESYRGFVANWTSAKDACIHSHLQHLHGSFIEPITISTSSELFPIFGGSKLTMNNDILLPAPIYWSDEARFTIGDHRNPWSAKQDKLVWRGTASGGRNRATTWTGFQRHRLLSMLNSTQATLNLQEVDDSSNKESNRAVRAPHNFPLPDKSLYTLRTRRKGSHWFSLTKAVSLPEWLSTLSDAAFVWLNCFPWDFPYFGCSYNDMYYAEGQAMSFEEQFSHKYMPDIDGNSFSGRYRAFLRSNSLPIKATVYSEWHDDRLFAWKHFVPMDNTFVDLYGIMSYFLDGRDAAAEKIAKEGSDWADKVLRKEDMLVYVYRLALEYARLCDDQRNDLGFVGDLKSK